MNLQEASMTDDDRIQVKTLQRSAERKIFWAFIVAFCSGSVVVQLLIDWITSRLSIAAFFSLTPILIFVAVVAGRYIYKNAMAVFSKKEGVTRRDVTARKISYLIGPVMMMPSLLFPLFQRLGAAPKTTEGTSSTQDFLDILFSNQHLDIGLMSFLIVYCLIIFPVLGWYNRRHIVDELAINLSKEGAYWTAEIFAVIVPIWWLLWRGGILPEPGVMSIYLACMFTWTAIGVWKGKRWNARIDKRAD
jgi:hypothetical protein